jgi:hypothetical protein
MLVEVSVVEQRYQAVLGVIKSGRSVVEVASARPRRWCWSGVGSIRGGVRGGCCTSWSRRRWRRCRLGPGCVGGWSGMG